MFFPRSFPIKLSAAIIGCVAAIGLAQEQSKRSVGYDDPLLVYLGRVSFASPDYSEFDWPCTGVSARLAGEGSVSISINGAGNRFLVTMDDRQSIIELPHSRTTVDLGMLIGNGPHSVTIRKLTEASYFTAAFLMDQKPVQFYSMHLEGDLELLPAITRSRRLEFFGDSSVNGFGIERLRLGALGLFTGLKSVENCSKTYASTLTKHFGADMHMQAWSGKGLLVNALRTSARSTETLPLYWNRTMATRADEPWDFQSWQPDAVILQLGGNDYYMRPYPTADDFKSAYRHLLETIHSSYGTHKPLIISVCGQDAHHIATNCLHIKEVTKELDAVWPGRLHYVELDPNDFSDKGDWGSLHHLSEQGHATVAGHLKPLLESWLGWEPDPNAMAIGDTVGDQNATDPIRAYRPLG